MAELIGLIASILQLVDTVAKAGTLIKDLHNAPKEQQQLFSEVQSLQPLIVTLQDRLQDNSSFTGIQKLTEPLLKFEDTMKHCTKKLKTADGALGRVSWTLWNKQEAKEDLDKLECFKSLLNTWLTVDIWDVSQQKNRNQTGIFTSVNGIAHEQQQQIKVANRDRIIEWVTPLNFFQRQADVFKAWQPGTGDWLLADAHFKDWESSTGSVLWCHGMAGAGKTVLASLVVNHLSSQSQKNIGVGTLVGFQFKPCCTPMRAPV
ncbi:hypothetical protein C8R44DRAFT_861913 [Mycena epipterygia]|nr:hypothetical protein C8R44DRAFT_861913 [Mycena epipterygia]